jgi:hypothetical protein
VQGTRYTSNCTYKMTSKNRIAVLTRSDWLRTKGGRTEFDVVTDEYGDYVLMSGSQFRLERVYSPSSLIDTRNDNTNRPSK